jgi:hypothetical protein
VNDCGEIWPRSPFGIKGSGRKNGQAISPQQEVFQKMGMFVCVALLGLDLMAFFLGTNTSSLGAAVITFLVPVFIMSGYTVTHIEKDNSPAPAHH